eukprot:TRINITY_DN2301_c0_g2_i2.p1 TRINITY_DN2301_c0_g2~~TRINITY_DN2301_c0_g2_i2.p1  ORF type:complete len:460 (-),score=134.76 TRINITY_DN2301_c0_g2_i2:103-1482(-)
MDPLSAAQAIVGVVLWVKQQKDNIEHAKKECARLTEQMDLAMSVVNNMQGMLEAASSSPRLADLTYQFVTPVNVLKRECDAAKALIQEILEIKFFFLKATEMKERVEKARTEVYQAQQSLASALGVQADILRLEDQANQAEIHRLAAMTHSVTREVVCEKQDDAAETVEVMREIEKAVSGLLKFRSDLLDFETKAALYLEFLDGPVKTARANVASANAVVTGCLSKINAREKILAAEILNSIDDGGSIDDIKSRVEEDRGDYVEAIGWPVHDHNSFQIVKKKLVWDHTRAQGTLYQALRQAEAGVREHQQVLDDRAHEAACRCEVLNKLWASLQLHDDQKEDAIDTDQKSLMASRKILSESEWKRLHDQLSVALASLNDQFARQIASVQSSPAEIQAIRAEMRDMLDSLPARISQTQQGQFDALNRDMKTKFEQMGRRVKALQEVVVDQLVPQMASVTV